MERIILMVLRSLHKIPKWWYKLCLYGRDEKFEKYSEEKRYNLLHELVTHINRVSRIEVVATGMENLPQEGGYMLFANHQGLFDVILFVQTHGRFLSAVFKKEVENVIFIKQVARMIAAKAMDRDDVRQSMRVIKEVSEEVKKGRVFLIFPEGTRSRMGNKMGEFKNGAFKSAVYAKCPIVPVAIIDSYKALDTHSIAPMTAQIHYLEPIPYEAYKGMKTHEIGAMIKERIEAIIAQYVPENEA